MPIPSAGTSSRPRAPTSESNEYKSPSACPECGATDCDKATCLGESSSRPPAYKRHKAWNGAENRDKSSNRISNRLLYCRKDDDAWVDISNDRLRNSRLGALYPGSRFKGVQRCREVSYEVSVDIQHVDIRESTLSGYLNIKGLTDEYPELTTFFQGEIIGPKYSFLTRKWQAQQVVDALHWKRFPSFQPYVDIFNNDGFVYEPYEKDFIYMRWKEHFLVPDHRVRTIDGASFAGFYYICYQRSTNEIKGYYFFRNHSDWFQELSLKHEEQRSFASFEFR